MKDPRNEQEPMNRNSDPTTPDHDGLVPRLSEHLDGLLEGDEARAMERHLEECEECRRTLADLERVRDAAGRFRDRPPRRDLWPGIRAAMGGRRDAPVRRAGGGGPPRRRGVFLSPSQLAAAAAVLVVLGGAGAWGLGLATTGRPSAETDDRAFMVAESVDDAGSGYSDEVERLEGLLASSRDRLTPATARVLEKNLAIIDAAIRESLAALESDPGNAWVRDHLRRSRERKLDYLRDAADLVEWSAAD